MNNHRAPTFSLITAATLAAAVLMAAPASAQVSNCQPGDLFCAEVRIGPGSAGIRIGGRDEAPPPPPVYQVEPPTVYVQPAPQPPTVYVQPAPPPPPVYIQPAPPPPPIYIQQPPPPMVIQQPVTRQPQEDRFPASSLGIHLHGSGLFGEDLAMAGAGAALRIRPIPHLALDVGAGVYGGNDYNGMDRVEVPVTLDALFFFNPQHRFQFYALIGLGGSFGHAEGYNVFVGGYRNRDYFHLGGQAGLGVEWRISRVFALNLDVRGFLRQRVDGNEEPEFTEVIDGRSMSTDTSGGVTGQLGMTFYFGM